MGEPIKVSRRGAEHAFAPTVVRLAVTRVAKPAELPIPLEVGPPRHHAAEMRILGVEGQELARCHLHHMEDRSSVRAGHDIRTLQELALSAVPERHDLAHREVADSTDDDLRPELSV